MNIKRTIVLGASLIVAVGAFAEEAESNEEAAPEKQAVKQSVKFTTLPFIERCSGTAEVLKTGSQEWIAVEEGRFYPLGSTYRTKEGGSLALSFGNESKASISGEASFATRVEATGSAVRTVIPLGGTLEVTLPRNIPEGAFVVTAPGFTVYNPAGESKYIYKDVGDGDDVIVRCVTGTMAVKGRHFSIARMRAADEFRIRTTHDHLETILYGNSGDYVVKLDKGMVGVRSMDENGAIKENAEPAFLEWHLSPETKVQINRAVPSIGERMSVTVIAFDTAGEPKHNYAFAEGRVEVNTGELIVPTSSESEKAAKKAADAAEAEETTEAVEDDGEEKSDEKKDEEKKEDSSEE